MVEELTGLIQVQLDKTFPSSGKQSETSVDDFPAQTELLMQVGIHANFS